MIGQLVTIKVRQRFTQTEVFWYHVPRIGDGLVIYKDENGVPRIDGFVERVIWHDDYVEVVVK